MMANQNFIGIEILNSENYDTWRIHMKSILIKSDYWGYIDGTIQRPEESDDGYSKWKRVDEKVKAEILLLISAPLLKDVQNCNTAKDIWMTLKDTYDSSVPTRKATLLKRLILNKASSNNISAHISEFFDVVEKLKSIDVKIDDDLLSVLLLYSLPDEFENFRVAIESRDDLPPPMTLKVKILEESNARGSQTSSSQVLMVEREKNI